MWGRSLDDRAASLLGPGRDDGGGTFGDRVDLGIALAQHAVEFADRPFHGFAGGARPAVDGFGQMLAEAGEVAEAGVEQARKGLVGRVERALRRSGPVLQQRRETIGCGLQLLAAQLEGPNEFMARRREALARRLGSLGHKRRDALPGGGQIAVERSASAGKALVDVILNLHEPGREGVSPRGDILPDADGDALDAGRYVCTALVEVGDEFLVRSTQALFDAGDLLGDMPRHAVRCRRELGRDLLCGCHEPVGDLGAVRFDMSRRSPTGLGHRIGYVLALGTEGRDCADTGFRDVVGDPRAGGVEVACDGFVRARNGAPHAVGIDQDGLAFVGEFIDHGPDATLVLGIGPLEVGDFGAHERLQLTGTRMSALDPITHRGNFPADGMGQTHDLFGRKRFRFGQTHGDLGHRAGREPHFLRAPHQGRKDEEQHDGARRGGQRNQGLRAAGRGDVQPPGEEAALGSAIQANRGPKQRAQAGDQKGCRTRSCAQRLQHLPDRAPVVVGMQTRFGHQTRCRAAGILERPDFGRRPGLVFRLGDIAP